MNTHAGKTIRFMLGAVLMVATTPVAWGACKELADTGCTDLTSPKWQGTMVHHQLAGHPRWPNIVELDGSIDTQIWPGLHYWVYVPPAAAGKKTPSLLIYIHGTNQNPEKAARSAGWNQLADERGFVVLYPMGGDGNNWAWGQTTAYGRGAGELDAVARITAEVHDNYGTNPQRTFVTGISSGAITATMLGAMYTEFYRAVGSFLGGSYNLSDPTGDQAYAAMRDGARVVKVTPAFLVHGTLDYIFTPPLSHQADTQWVGTNDRADNGSADGSISPTPEIDDSHRFVAPAPDGGTDICLRNQNNPCTGDVLGYPEYPYEIHRYKDEFGQGRTIVESWWIHGLSHNYPHGDATDPGANYTDPAGPSIEPPMFQFFESINVAPGAADDAATTRKGTAVSIDVVANDVDSDNDELALTSVSQPANGSATRDGAKVRYVPRLGFKGLDAFSYTVADGHGGSDAAQVTVCVTNGGPGC
jgi:poly(hydroxyalkanoate) depolymerase family esterase